MIRSGTLSLPAGWRRWRIASFLQECGDLLQRRQDVIRRIQWFFVVLYLSLLIAPVALPAAQFGAERLQQLAKFAEILFWGLWWPGVVLSMLLFGQFWCGLLCPDGTLSEFASRHGKGWKIPAWMRWAGWPLLLFSLITVYEHLIDAYRWPQATLLMVGGTSLLATINGFFIARGKRVWCRYLCPGGSLFSLLARASIFHFRVDRAAWDAASKPLPRAVDCPPLLDVRRLRSNEKCSMCGRCSGHRNAVALAMRSPGAEISTMEEGDARRWEALAICFVLIGLCYGVIHWRGSHIHQGLTALFERWSANDLLLAPVSKWLFYSAHGEATGATALVALATMLLLALAFGGAVAALLLAGARGRIQRASLLAYSLIPLAGLGLFLGALEHAFSLLVEAGVSVNAIVPWVRGLTVSVGGLWSLQLGLTLIGRVEKQAVWRCLAIVAHALILALLAAMYQWAP